ncbi:hypothetical protein M1145_00300, partial [Patescibacteria group bacterium]|nr:hypothetical protein [Patescibacteria group bacterium]
IKTKKANIKMYIFISQNINKDKEKRLEMATKDNKLIDIIKSKRPLSDAIKFSKEKNIELLFSTDK